jgi:hypothetical protein
MIMNLDDYTEEHLELELAELAIELWEAYMGDSTAYGTILDWDSLPDSVKKRWLAVARISSDKVQDESDYHFHVVDELVDEVEVLKEEVEYLKSALAVIALVAIDASDLDEEA